jgi:FtsP/CotA-like multicopper oxidase with cupredoxin domain
VARLGHAALAGSGAAPTRVWGYGGTAPGPLLRARQGDEVHFRLVNDLPQATSIHWHGIRVPNAMDGVSGLTQDAVPPGESFDYRFRVPDAGTYWYHSHNRSWEQMARGLHGALVVEESEPPAVDQDLVLVVDDWRLDDAGQIDEASFGAMHDWAHAGRLGNWLTVNGRSRPDYPVRAGERLRLRLLNAANARVMEFRFPDHRPQVIAYDGQPHDPEPLGSTVLSLAPGQRADLILDMELDPGATANIEGLSGGNELTIARFRYDATEVRRENPLAGPVRLPANPLARDLDLAGALKVDLLMEGGAMGAMAGASLKGRRMDTRELVENGMVWAFNGIAGMPETPLVRAAPGRTVLIDMMNDTRWPHAMHLHGHHFRAVARGEQQMARSPWRDTELVEAGERVVIAFVADNPGKWLFHCHMLEHQAAGMLTWLEVG